MPRYVYALWNGSWNCSWNDSPDGSWNDSWDNYWKPFLEFSVFVFCFVFLQKLDLCQAKTELAAVRQQMQDLRKEKVRVGMSVVCHGGSSVGGGVDWVIGAEGCGR